MPCPSAQMARHSPASAITVESRAIASGVRELDATSGVAVGSNVAVVQEDCAVEQLRSDSPHISP